MSVAGHIAGERDSVLFIGSPNGLEATLVPAAGVEFKGLPAAGFDRARPWTLVTSSVGIAVSALRAWSWMGADRPDVVIGFGGYVSIPVGVAALLRRVPLVIHEQNSVPGMANRFLSRWASAVGVTYPDSAELMRRPRRVRVTGNPVREEVLDADRHDARAGLGIPEGAVVMLAFGGSRGARHLNEALIRCRSRLLKSPGVIVIHVAGRAEYESVLAAAGDPGDAHERWRVLPYLEDMASGLAAADLVVARAGATSIAEITARGLPAVLVPYPYATDDHQTKNAEAMKSAGAASVFPDRELDSDAFGDELVTLLSDPVRRATMAAASRSLGVPDASQRLVALALEAAQPDSSQD